MKKLGKEFIVRVDEIEWLESAGNYVNLHVGKRISFDGRAFAEDPAEIASIEADRPLTWWFKLLTGFPPRYFVRLEPHG